MWSGPRTVSTALMRSFENRADTVVVDEPLYGYYLARSAVDHPGRDEVIASMPATGARCCAQLSEDPLPPGKAVYYQKHMTHHLLPEIDRERARRAVARVPDPRSAPAARLLRRVRSRPVLADIGLAQQAEIFRAFGGPVIDSADILRAPRAGAGGAVRRTRRRFDPAMLSWPPGPRPTDGVWARYWYEGSGARLVRAVPRSRRSSCPRSWSRWPRDASRSTTRVAAASAQRRRARPDHDRPISSSTDWPAARPRADRQPGTGWCAVPPARRRPRP